MPFGDPVKEPERRKRQDAIYSQWIKPCVESVKIPGNSQDTISCDRADKQLRPGEIIADIIESLVTSDIVIADLSGRNPNVFYELGVRHTVGRNTILIAENMGDIPFDLRGLRTITYSYDPEGMLALRDCLQKAILEILDESERIDNPVHRFLYNREVDKLLKESVPPGYSAIKDIVSELSTLRTEFDKYIGEVRHIMNVVTSSQKVSVRGTDKDIGLEFFEGAWHNRATKSCYYARLIDGELLVPYCYGGNTCLSAHFYNCRVIGHTLFARFQWFHGADAGYVFFKVVGDNRLEGGWWYSWEVPPDRSIDITRIVGSSLGMTEIVLERQGTVKRFPPWAEEYFKTITVENHR